MLINRVFLDWRQPALPAAADFLIERARIGRPVLRGAAGGQTLDLRGMLVAVPAARAGRRLLELLVERAADDGCGLVPPEIVTVGRLPELLYEAKRPFAEDFTQHLAWVRALQAVPRERLGRFVRSLPDDDDLAGWLALGETLARVHRELAADALNFEDVLHKGEQVPGFDEAPRWTLLSEIRERYLRLLDALGLWDRQTARLFAIEHGECQIDRHIVLVGAVDLNQATRAMLDQVADRVTAVVFGPPACESRFDEHGCLVPEAWQDAVIEGVFERAEVVDSPADQSTAVARALAGFGGRYTAEEITVGVPDESLTPWIIQRLQECGLPVRYGVGPSVPRTGPGRLLCCMADYLERPTFAALSALVRHPAVERLVAANGGGTGWLEELDNFYAERLPFALSDEPEVARVSRPVRGASDTQPAGRTGRETRGTGMAVARRVVDRLTGPLRGPAQAPAEWVAAVVELLLDVYGDRDLDRTDPHDRQTLAACENLREALEQHRHVPAELAPQLSGAAMLRHVLRSVEDETVPPAADSAAIELLGWLELPLDDAPALVVTSFNEGFVPSSLNADAFLPNELRRRLGLNDNDRRYARDAYALSMLAQSRRELRIIAGRRTADGDPLAPSRLLFAGPDEDLPTRVLRLFAAPGRRQHPVLAGSLAAGRERAAFTVPRPTPLDAPVTAMRVTEFRDYLNCPYRYYLRRRLKLEARDTASEELDPAAFGTLLHDVLAEFGLCEELRASTDADQINRFLNDALDALANERFPGKTLPAVGVQIEQVRVRLKEFARWQAGWAAEGWRIIRVEEQVDGEGAHLLVDGEPMPLRGRIDRIDVRESPAGLAFVVFDYKTGERGTTPEEQHRRQGEWVDLQLPLYRHLVRALDPPGADAAVQLGYIVLPREVRRTGARLADWSAADLAEADRVAQEVVRAVRGEVFWPPAEDVGRFDDFADLIEERLLEPAE